MTNAPIPDNCITFGIPPEVAIRVIWRRTLIRPKRLAAFAIIFVLGVLCIVFLPDMMIIGIGALFYLVLFPILFYRYVEKRVRSSILWTDHKTMEFTPTHIITSGADWKMEFPWARYRKFAEDNHYFYLVVLDGLSPTSILPKDAFTPQQAEAFRQLAMANTVSRPSHP